MSKKPRNKIIKRNNKKIRKNAMVTFLLDFLTLGKIKQNISKKIEKGF